MVINIEKAGCDFCDFLTEIGYWSVEDCIQNVDKIISDLEKIYEVAPRFVQLLADISGE